MDVGFLRLKKNQKIVKLNCHHRREMRIKGCQDDESLTE